MSERLRLVNEAIGRSNAAKEEAVYTIKTLLDEATKNVLEKRSQPLRTPKLARVQLEDLHGFFVDLGAQSEGHESYAYVLKHVVLNSDGKLYTLNVVGERDEDDDWKYIGTLGQELDSEGYLELGPVAMQKLEQLLSKQPVMNT